jgi:lysophospholipase L1-like esterase
MKSLLQHLLLVVGGVFAGLLFLEMGVRALMPHPQVLELAVTEPKPDTERAPGSEPERIELSDRINKLHEPGIYVMTPTGRRLRPNAHAIIRNHYLCKCTTDIRTNSLGYRNPEIGEKTTKTRVLFLGDSITLADYVPEDQTWVRRVEQLSASTPNPLETINAGVWAIGLADELAILLETGLSTNPDVVVLGWYLNDVEPSPGIQMIRPPEHARHSWLAQYAFQGISRLRAELVTEDVGRIDRETRNRWKEETARKFPPDEPEGSAEGRLNRMIYDIFGDFGSAWSDGAWERMKPYFIELKRQADLHDFELFIVAFPIQQQVRASILYDHPQQKLRQVADELDIPLLDLLPLLREANSGRAGARSKLFYDWCHHTPYGNELIAEWVHAFLQNQLGS